MAPAKEPIKKEVKHRAPATHPAAHIPAHAASHSTSHAARHAAPAAHAAAHHPVAHSAVRAGERYTEATGRRKTAVARVRIMAGNGKMLVNDKEPKAYFLLPRLLAAAVAPLRELNLIKDMDVTVHVSGGGISAQAEAVRHGLSRALVLKTPEWKPRLRAMGYLTRDSRMVERKKYGLRKARRAPQWAKR